MKLAFLLGFKTMGKKWDERTNEQKERKKEQNRKYYQQNKDYFKKRNKKRLKSVENIARKNFWNAIRSGKITRGDCLVCGKSDAEGHHEDYSLPFDVLWLCTLHHRRLHTGRSIPEMILEVM